MKLQCTLLFTWVLDLLCDTILDYGCRISFINGPIRSVCDRGKGRFSNAFSDISQHVLNRSCLFFSLSKLCRKQILNCTASLVWSLYHPSESQILTLATDSQVNHLTLLFISHLTDKYLTILLKLDIYNCSLA